MKKFLPVILTLNFVVPLVFALVHFRARSVHAASNELYFLHTDHLDSTRAVTDRDGNVVARCDYWPYGATNNQQLTTDNQLTERLFTSQIRDTDSDLYFYNSRYYNSALGTFISADPVQGPNRYAYVSNNPINMIDPSGNMVEAGDGGGGARTSLPLKGIQPIVFWAKPGEFGGESVLSTANFIRSERHVRSFVDPTDPRNVEFFSAVTPSNWRELSQRDLAWGLMENLAAYWGSMPSESSQALQKGGSHNIIDNIYAGHGACMHHALALHLALAGVDIPSIIVEQNVRYSKDGEGFPAHVLVAAPIEGEWWLLDPSGFGERMSVVRIENFQELYEKYGNLPPESFKPFNLSLEGDPYHLLGSEEFPWLYTFSEYLSGLSKEQQAPLRNVTR